MVNEIIIIGTAGIIAKGETTITMQTATFEELTANNEMPTRIEGTITVHVQVNNKRKQRNDNIKYLACLHSKIATLSTGHSMKPYWLRIRSNPLEATHSRHTI